MTFFAPFAAFVILIGALVYGGIYYGGRWVLERVGDSRVGQWLGERSERPVGIALMFLLWPFFLVTPVFHRPRFFPSRKGGRYPVVQFFLKVLLWLAVGVASVMSLMCLIILILAAATLIAAAVRLVVGLFD